MKNRLIHPVALHFVAIVSFSLICNHVLANLHDIDRPVCRIRVSGNEQTQTSYILKWAGLKPGELATHEKLKSARQNILNTAFFKRVDLNTRVDG